MARKKEEPLNMEPEYMRTMLRVLIDRGAKRVITAQAAKELHAYIDSLEERKSEN